MVFEDQPLESLQRHWPSHDSGQTVSLVEQDVENYLRKMMDDFAHPATPAGVRSSAPAGETAEAVFAILTRREFCYLSKTKARCYWPGISGHLEAAAAAEQPLRFYLDIGGGYHATTRPGRSEPVFVPGLGELLVLRQIRRFQAQVRPIYPRNAHFSLVIDNLCALLVNDIPLYMTERYCNLLRQLITSVGLEESVDLLVESEVFSPSDYVVNGNGVAAPEPSAAEVENVSRFLGRTCCPEEAKARIVRYKSVTAVSEAHLGRMIDGVHMTQRATATTFGFRPFPGGDSRIQAGEVVLTAGTRGRVVPKLFTSHNWSASIRSLDLPGLLPAPLTWISYAPVD